MSQSEILLPKGVRDTLPEKTAKRKRVAGELLSIFDKNGYLEVTTPLLEFLDVVTQGTGKDLRKRIVKFTDRATGRSVALRPDFTPQIARIVATHYRDRKGPVRLSYCGSVIRLAEDASGGQKELYQAGVELVGEPSASADAEIISLAIEALKASGLREFKIDIGQVEFVRGMLDEAGFNQTGKTELLDAISKKDIARITELSADAGKGHREAVSALPYLFGGVEVLKKAEACVTNERSEGALNNIGEVVAKLSKKGHAGTITIDLGEVRGFDYHTGIIFEGFVSGFGSSVCGGGRYDNLLAGYGYPSPATGFAVDIENLLSASERRES